jgi:hypothetical protein
VRVHFSSDALSHTARLIHSEGLERLEILGPTIQFVTDAANAEAPCIIRGTVPPGVSIPAIKPTRQRISSSLRT